MRFQLILELVETLLKDLSCLGGGVALLYASKELDKLPTANFDQKIGVQIIQNALKVCISFLHMSDGSTSENSFLDILLKRLDSSSTANFQNAGNFDV